MTVFKESNLHFEFDSRYNIIKSDNDVNIINAKSFYKVQKTLIFWVSILLIKSFL